MSLSWFDYAHHDPEPGRMGRRSSPNISWIPLRQAAMSMSSPLHTRPLFSFFLYDVCTSRPKRDLLLFVARHVAVTLTRNAPLFRAQSPGISVSSIEPSGVCLSRFCLSSSRSLGRCLLLGQRSRMTF